MILSKSQLILILLSGFIMNPRIIKKIQYFYRNMPENLFIEQCKKELNYKLDPIRKNLYLVN